MATRRTTQPGRAQERCRLRPESLHDIQRWLQDEIFRPNELPARERPKDTATADEVVTPSKTLTAVERTGIYARLLEVRLYNRLAEDFSIVRHILDDVAFDRLVREYTATYPPRSYSIDHFGLRLPEFFARDAAASYPDRGLLLDGARLEVSLLKIFDAPSVTPLDAASFQAIAPAEWERVILRTTPGLEVLRFDYPVSEYLTAIRGGTAPSHPEPRETWTVIYRRDQTIFRLDLEPAAASLLDSLRRGTPFLRAVEAVAETWETGAQDLDARMFRWLREWVGEGLFWKTELVD